MPNSQRHSSGTAEGGTVEIVRPDELEGLRAEWAALWCRCPAATPFQAPEWLLPWTRGHAPGRCGAVALRGRGRLLGLLPVFCWEGAMLLAGTGPSDHGNVLLEPGTEEMAADMLAALPDVPCGAFRRIDLRQLPARSPLLAAPAPFGWTERRGPDEPCLVAPLRGEDGLAAASKRRRASWRYAMRRLEREGASVELVTLEEAATAMDELTRLHGLRWRERGERGVLADPLLHGLLTTAAPELAGAGLLRFYRLRLREEAAAALMVFAGREAHHYYIGGFDPDCATFSPSAALIGAAMAQAHREGAIAFDFLRGAEPYKGPWGAEARATHRRLLIPPA